MLKVLRPKGVVHRNISSTRNPACSRATSATRILAMMLKTASPGKILPAVFRLDKKPTRAARPEAISAMGRGMSEPRFSPLRTDHRDGHDSPDGAQPISPLFD